MKKSIFTLMALMATAVCGLTSCSDSDDDYVAPAAAVAAPTENSLDGYTIMVEYPGAPAPAPWSFANGNATSPGAVTYPYTYNHETGELEMYDATQNLTINVKLDFTANTWTEDMGGAGESYPITYTKA